MRILNSITKKEGISAFGSYEREDRSLPYILTLILLSTLSLALLFWEILLPINLLSGPLLYGFMNNSSYKSFLPHCLPMIIFGGLNLINLQFGFFSEFMEVYILTVTFSLLFYSILAISSLSDYEEEYYISRKLGSELSILFLLTAFFLGILALEKMIDVDMGFDVKILFYITSIMCIMFNISYLVSKGLKFPTFKKSEKVETRNPSLFTLELLDYDERIKTAFREKEIFLNSNLTLDKLSTELNIPKHHLTKYFNFYLGTNFFNFVALYRIHYAVERIQERNIFTIESLAHESGFNSKTSFVKYFKQYIGVVPSQYVTSLQVKI